MKVFLTSHLCFYDTPEIDPSNGLIERLRAALPDSFSTVFVCSNPYAHERTVFFANEIEQGFSNAGFSRPTTSLRRWRCQTRVSATYTRCASGARTSSVATTGRRSSRKAAASF